MLELLLKLYTTTMVTGVTSPVPHLFGPPGCGKSTVAYDLAATVQRRLHVLNVSRLSPLEVEGVQMPELSESGKQKLKLLLATIWNDLEEGDVVLLDEFLRGFPEVYNALLDIITSREVAGHKLPRVFIMAASNSIVTYDKALEDRLHHLPVPDPRKRKSARKHLAQLIVDKLGLLPEMTTSIEMERLIDVQVLPMFDVLDNLKNRTSTPSTLKGRSIRNLIGQAQLRDIQAPELTTLLSTNNQLALRQGKPQYVFLTDAASIKAVREAYLKTANTLQKKAGQFTEVQRQNLNLNLQLIEMETVRYERGIPADDDDTFHDDPPF